MAARVVLFDLDGTLSDSAPGILAALRHAFAENGVPALDPQQERALLGPPFHESLPPVIGSALLEDVIASYRAHYGAGGMYDTAVYPGITELLARLQVAGTRLAVATSKPEPFAVPIVERLGLTPYFETVGGDTLDGLLATKAKVIADVLDRLGHPDPSGVVMVGDRSHDVVGARAHNLRAVAVSWGYAVPGELATAEPDALCADVDELGRVLGVEAADAQAS